MRDNHTHLTESTKRRGFLRGVGAAGLVGATGSLSGCLGGDDDEFPSETIDVLVTAPAGGGSDTYTRQIWNQVADQNDDVDVAIENDTAGGGVSAVNRVHSADPDGHKVVIYNQPFSIRNVFEDQGFSMTELDMICGFTESVWVLAVDPDLGIEDFDDVLQRYREGELEDTAGQEPGLSNHLIWEVMRDDPEFDFTFEQYIAYGGSGPILEAILTGEVPAGIVTETAAEPQVEAGEIEVVVAFASDGSTVFPDLPSVTDLGYPNIDFVGSFWRGFATAPDTPDDIVETQADLVREAVEGDELQGWSEETGNPLWWLAGPEEADAMLEEVHDDIEDQIDPDWFM